MKNEFGETIDNEELTNFSKRVQKLSDEKIDELWHRCEFIISDREEKYKAIRQRDIDKIRESLDSSEIVLSNLISETELQVFRENLEEVEKS